MAISLTLSPYFNTKILNKVKLFLNVNYATNWLILFYSGPVIGIEKKRKVSNNHTITKPQFGTDLTPTGKGVFNFCSTRAKKPAEQERRGKVLQNESFDFGQDLNLMQKAAYFIWQANPSCLNHWCRCFHDNTWL